MGRKLINSKNETNKEINMSQDLYPFSPFVPHEEDRIVYLTSDMNELSVSNVIQGIFSYAKRDSTKPIYLIISSYGGAVDEMFGLFDIIKYVKCPIHTIGLSKVMSAGVLILASGNKGNRKLGKNCRIMLHPISGGQFGNVFEQDAGVIEMKRMQTQMIKLLAEECNQKPKTFKEILDKGHEQYLTAEEALNLGIADELI